MAPFRAGRSRSAVRQSACHSDSPDCVPHPAAPVHLEGIFQRLGPGGPAAFVFIDVEGPLSSVLA